MTPSEAFASFSASLIGLPVSHVWRGHGSAFFLELGQLSPVQRRDGSPGNLEGEAALGVEWSWRIEDQASILCGSWSDEHLWEPVFDKLRGNRVGRCELFGPLPEVAITLDNGVRFLSFSTTDGQPRWQLMDRRDGSTQWFTVREGRLHLGDGTEPLA